MTVYIITKIVPEGERFVAVFSNVEKANRLIAYLNKRNPESARVREFRLNDVKLEDAHA